MYTWGEYRQLLRETVLNDTIANVDRRRFGDNELLIYCGWALNALCSHTAKPAVHTIENFTGSVVDISELDVYDEFANTAYVVIGGEVFDSAYHSKRFTPSTSGNLYIHWPVHELRLRREIQQPSFVEIRYFTRWPKPEGIVPDPEADPPVTEGLLDDFVMDFPAWAHAAVSYMIAGHAIAGHAMSSANLRQWAETPEKGGPEDNPFRAQQKWLFAVAERELALVPRQDRANFFKET